MKKFENYKWQDVPILKYKEDNSPFRGVTRQVLFDGSFDLPCQLRYFEVEKGGYSTLESHEHTHFVMIYRGAGQALLGEEVIELSVGDIVTIPSRTMHQFRANRDKTMGFLCLVDKNRDKVKLPTEAKISELLKNKKIKEFLDDYKFENIRNSKEYVFEKNIGEHKLIFETSKQFDDLPIIMAVTKRVGGKSKGSFESLNVGLHVNDEKEAVIFNRRLIAKALDLPAENMVFAEQVHKDNVVKITANDAGKGLYSYETSIPKCDAMYTNEKNIPLTICIADCLPVFIYDEKHHAMAVVHAGWRGVANFIVHKTIRAMGRDFGTEREDVQVYIGPGIARKSFAVSQDLAEKFEIKFGKDVVSYYWKNDLNEATPHVDLSLALVQSLVRFGVPNCNIIASETNTFEDKMAFSYRRDGNKTGRMGLIAMLK